MSKRKAKIFKYLEMVAPILPTPLYWLNINGIMVGANDQFLKIIGAPPDFNPVGKTAFDAYPKEIAGSIVQHNEEVMKSGIIGTQEEFIENISSGNHRYLTSIKAPLRDIDGSVIGLVGTSVDITDRKEAERLRLENELHQQSLQEQEKFKKIVNQVVHDIRSPVASLQMTAKYSEDLPEELRVTIREAIARIEDTANDLLLRYRDEHINVNADVDKCQPLLVSSALLELITEKKGQYRDRQIRFDSHFSQIGNFAFVKIEPSSFKRMISNLINNSVDALNEKSGSVIVGIEVTEKLVKVTIKDNGKGMSQAVADKIMQNMVVTSGKKEGHGLGLSQVRETLQRNNAKLSIKSKIGHGTKITLTFPKIAAPDWIAEEMELHPEDTIIILDDDPSIHKAWDTRLDIEVPEIPKEHFTYGKEAIEFINALSPEDKRNIFLLTDYELLKQDMNGLDVVVQTDVARSILVTSHHANESVRTLARETDTKILPKQLASEIPINMVAAKPQVAVDKLKQVDVVVVDDDVSFVNSLLVSVFKGMAVDKYYDPQSLLDNVAQYPKDTKICLDNNFTQHKIKGITIARKLHHQGFTNLYLISGEVFEEKTIQRMPKYLTLIMKKDIEQISTLKNA